MESPVPYGRNAPHAGDGGAAEALSPEQMAQERAEADLDDLVLAMRTEAISRGIPIQELDVRVVAHTDAATGDFLDDLAAIEQIVDEALPDPPFEQDEEQAATRELGQAPATAVDFPRAHAITPLERKQKTELFAGSALTLVCYCLLRYNWAMAHKIGECALRELLLEDAHFFPKPNNVPRTVYSMRRVLGLKEPREYLRHHCPCGHHVWSAAAVEGDPLCPDCKIRVRSKAKAFYWFGVKNNIVSLMSDESWRKLRGTGPGRDKDADTGAVKPDPYGWFGASEFKRLETVVPELLRTAGIADEDIKAHLLSNTDNSHYEIGIDWFQPYINKSHSVGLVVMRCMDLPAEFRGKRRYVRVLAILPGPKDDPCLVYLLRLIAREFKDCGPGSSGINIASPAVSMQHRIFLTGLVADAPALAKITLRMQHNSLRGCPWCCVLGVSEDHITRFLGYSASSPASLWGKDAFPEAGGQFPDKFHFVKSKKKSDMAVRSANTAGYVGPRLTSEQHRERDAQAGEACRALMDANAVIHAHNNWKVGVPPNQLKACKLARRTAEEMLARLATKGGSPLAELGYVDLGTLPIVAVCHAALYGLVKKTLELLFKEGTRKSPAPWYAFSSAARAVMRKRGMHVLMPHDINRAYRCVVDNRGWWVMEEYLHFILFLSELIFMLPLGGDGDIFSTPPEDWVGTVDENPIRRMWQHLQAAMRHYMCLPGTVGWSVKARLKARTELLSFNELAQRIFGSQFCTFNMHVLVCQLWHQEEARGAVVYSQELVFVENSVQESKSAVKGRVPYNCEALMARRACERMNLPIVSAQNPDTPSTVHDLPDVRAQPARAARLQEREGVDVMHDPLEADPKAHVFLLQKGRSKASCAKHADYGASLVGMVRSALLNFAKSTTSHASVPAWLCSVPADPAANKRQQAEASQALASSIAALDFYIFKGASLKGLEVVWSELYHRSRTRVSHWVKVQYAVEKGGDTEFVPYIAHVKCYAMVVKPGADGQPQHVRCAITDLYKLDTLVSGWLYDAGTMKEAARCHKNYAVPLDDIHSKMIHCYDEYEERHFFLAYDVHSQMSYRQE